MGKKLVIAEKPSVAKDLAKELGASHSTKHYYEGAKVIVTWCYGHLLTLKMPEDYNKQWSEWKMEDLPMIPKKFGIKPLPKTRGQLKVIADLAKRKDVSGAVIATDAGREGELVARWVLEYIHFNKPVERLWISSQTSKAIQAGFHSLKPAAEYDNLYQSALARAKADWLVGLNLTRALTVKYQDNLSSGRVQTPTLAFVNEREQQISRFIPKQQWKVTIQMNALKATLPKVFSTKEEAEQWVQLQSTSGKVENIARKEKREQAPLLYDLTTLQQEASRRFQFSAKKTLNLVQSLYERYKVVSYPRTDSQYLPTDLKNTLLERLQAVAALDKERILPLIKQKGKVVQTKVFNNQKVSDHYGLIPTEQAILLDKLPSDELKIYRLIVNRFLQLFEPVHLVEKETVTVKTTHETFTFTQQHVKESGWKKVDETEYQPLKRGQAVSLNFVVHDVWTKPQPRLTEADLLAKMEKFHLGTPATRAEIIEKLIHSELMLRQGHALVMTPKGKQLLDLVNPRMKTPELTEKWELQLQKIERGNLAPQVFIKQIIQDTKQLVKETKDSDETYRDYSLTTKKCPECGSPLKERQTKQGALYVCTNADCSYKRRKDPKVSNHRCPQCHHKMYVMDGKTGQYFKCPNCQLTEKMEGKAGRKKKMTKREEKRLLKKYSEKETLESPLAAALKAALPQDNE